jgi:hypothetical protein
VPSLSTSRGDERAGLEPGEALAEVRGLVPHERLGQLDALYAQELGQRVRRHQEILEPARGARRAEERGGAHGRRAAHRDRVHLAQQAEAQPLDEAALVLLDVRIALSDPESDEVRTERCPASEIGSA